MAILVLHFGDIDTITQSNDGELSGQCSNIFYIIPMLPKVGTILEILDISDKKLTFQKY